MSRETAAILAAWEDPPDERLGWPGVPEAEWTGTGARPYSHGLAPVRGRNTPYTEADRAADRAAFERAVRENEETCLLAELRARGWEEC